MSELPSKPCVVRPSLPKGDEVPNDAGLRPVSRMRNAGKGFLGSMGVHLVLIAAACSITLVGSGGAGRSVGSSAQKEDGFEMTISHDEQPSADQSPTFPVTAALPLVAATRSTVELPASTPIPDLPEAPAAVSPQSQTSAPSATNLASANTGAGAPSKAAKPGRGAGTDDGRITKRERPAPPPKLLHAPPPRYPAAARAAGKSGRVSVLVRVRSSGSAASTSLYKGCGNSQLDQAAVEAARSWTFSPTPTLGPDATIPVVVQVNFTL